ncbi:putative periplasmic or secreted lipoprotein [Xenococcus sp. PCC 7305]|uniref:BON domain-containing protein n=1 Tax=Xenococcus sp. PCC 7305 TaxID=102125 RepID=UPI0002ABF512|nr:BON domain-containing protein [Xenococcus sp. PCC 7305]ELS04145.1 putative periplasmic or secreted lipoprotein [Xenococcus sp. PCC 7305]
MNKLITFLLGGTMLFGAVACDVARTSSDAPDSVDESPVVEDITEVEGTLEDASSELRQAQLDSDIRAREERNDLFGEEGQRNDSDLESQVRAKLEANIPRAKLTVDAEDGEVAIVGTVPSQKEYESIKPLAQEILGVDNVKMEVEIVPSTEL